jgi:urease accessory protein
MSVATSRYDAPSAPAAGSAVGALQRGDGAAEIVFACRGAATALAHLYQRTPCRVLFPHAAIGEPPVAALLTTSGGIAGGDRLRIAVSVGDAASAVVTTAAAEKAYGSLGPEACVEIALTVAPGGWLEWLPQETILFDGARLVRRLTADIAAGGRLLAAEMMVFGRTARGEVFGRGLLHEAWRLRVAGRLVWADALRLDGDIRGTLDAAAAFAEARALATVAYIGADAGAHLPLARTLAEGAACRGGASVVNGVLLARFLGPRADAVRAAVAGYVSALRHAAAGWPVAMPALWNV